MSAAEEQKKRTLEALERRFIVAKAEIQQQEDKSNKRQLLEKSTSASKSEHKTYGSAKPSSSSLFKKDHSASQDTEANSPVYAPLSYEVDDNLLMPNPKISNRKGSMVDKILHELLENGDSAQKYMLGSRSMKIDNWILLDNYVPVRGLASGNKALPNHSKRSKKHMSMKQHKKIGSLEFPCQLHKFNSFMPMHEMWKGYITQLIKTVGRNQLAQCLLSADLHGAIIQVAQCKITSFTRISGIMIRETAETFGIITVDDKFRETLTIPANSTRKKKRSDMGTATFVEVILAILLPPVGVFLRFGLGMEFWICLLLTILGYLPGIIYALYVLVA